MMLIKKIISIMSLLSIFLISFIGNVYSLEVKTHRAINEHVAKSDISEFSINNYLINQLGFFKGYDEKINGKEIYILIGDGGEAEDIDLRPFNHFLNPLTDKGILAYYSALQWAMLPVGVQQSSPFASRNDAKQYFYTALTATDKAMRETNFAYTSGYKERSL